MYVIEADNISKQFDYGENMVSALNNVSLRVEKGKFITIVGPSGSGKTTLLNILSGLDKPTTGKVKILGRTIHTLNADALCVFRRQNIGFIFQNFNLLPMLSVYENIILPVGLDGHDIDKLYIKELISLLRIEEKTLSYPNKLSGGQQQRVSIARAFATKPQVVLADEPTGNLDTGTSTEVLKLMRELNTKFNQTMIMITHNEKIAMMADEIYQMSDGKLSKLGE